MLKGIIRVAIAGQGRSGFDIHARWLRQDAGRYKIVAIADEMRERRAQSAAELGCKTFAHWQDMLNAGGFDLFVNALPSPLHPPVSVAALRKGYHVVCEKPMAVRVAEFDRVVAEARKARRLFAPFQNSRFFPFFQKMLEVIESGKIGQVLSANIVWGNFARRWDWQTRQDLRGGNLNNTGPHPLDQAVVLFGSRMPQVCSYLLSGPGTLGDADDLAMVTLSGKGSPRIDITVTSYLAYPVADMYNVCGTLGGIAGGPKGLRWKWYNPAKAPGIKMHKAWSDKRNYCSETLPWQEDSWSLPEGHDDFQHNSGQFYRNVYGALTAGEKLIVQPAEVRRQVAILEACHQQNPLPKLAAKKRCAAK